MAKARPMVDITVGGMSSPEVEYNAASDEFWLTWRANGTRIDVTISGRESLRDLIRACIEAAEVEHAAHHEPVPGVARVD